MRKILLTALLVSGGLTASAQYLPNEGFENWKTACGKTDQTSRNFSWTGNPVGLTTRPGIEPNDWNGSNVKQTVFNQPAESGELVTKVNENKDGKTNSYVKLTCKKVGALGITSEAPAFINLATPWVFAITTKEKCDGGVYGGVSFTYKPDAIKGRYKRTPSSTKSEKAHIIAYLWNGTFKSSIPQLKDGETRTEDDVDRAVIGRVTSGISGDGKLIASCDYEFESTKENDWEEITVPINYKSGTENLTPAKMNVIISSNDYWTRTNLVENSTLEVDDVQFVYYHALKSISYNGQTLNIDEDKTDYDFLINEASFDINKLSWEKIGQGATVEPSFDKDTNILTITVKGNDYDKNEKSVTTYKFRVAKEATDFTNDLSVELVNMGMFDPEASTIQLYKELDDSYTFQLRNFMLMGGMMPVGTIILKNLDVNGNKITANQTIKIQKGDDPTIEEDSWMGPNLPDVPVQLAATRNGEDLTAQIDIDLSEAIGMVIKVVFAPTVEINGSTDFAAITPGLKNIHFTRPLKAGWNTICLPCNATVMNVTGDADNKIQEFTGADNNGLNFSEATSFEANVPYLVYCNNASDNVYFGAEIVAAEPRAICHGGFCFQGNYTPSFAMANRYGVADHGADGQFIQKGGEGSTLPATGAYFTGSGKSQSVKLNLGGDVTGINVNVVNDSNASAPVYDLKGVRVSNGSLNGLPKGLYVQGGKKVYVK